MTPLAFYNAFLNEETPQFLNWIHQIHALDSNGVIEEMGGGVMVQHFLQWVTGASNTLFRSMSTYDKVAQTKYYGIEKRSVSKEALFHILKQNLTENISFSLGCTASLNTDTLSAQHAWLGIKSHKKTWLLHLRFLVENRPNQQLALGILGVALLFQFLTSDSIALSQIEWMSDWFEIDVIHSSEDSPFETTQRQIQLVMDGWTPWVMFSKGRPFRALSMLRGESLLVYKGAFNPPSLAHLEMMKRSETLEAKSQAIFEISVKNVDKAQLSVIDYAHRIEMLSLLGYSVCVSKYGAFYEIKESFLNWGKAQAVHFVMGEDTYIRLLNPKYYLALSGGLNEGLQRLYSERTQVYIYQRELSKERTLNYHPQCHYQKFNFPISSTQIRNELLKNNAQVLDSIPLNLKTYILKNSLYNKV